MTRLRRVLARVIARLAGLPAPDDLGGLAELAYRESERAVRDRVGSTFKKGERVELRCACHAGTYGTIEHVFLLADANESEAERDYTIAGHTGFFREAQLRSCKVGA